MNNMTLCSVFIIIIICLFHSQSLSFYTSSGQKQSATFQNVHTSLGRVHVSTQSLMDEVSKMCLADLLYVSCVILSKLLENVTHD